ncbi:MAG: NifU N-terminal domain-containing protein [Planctomycetota bacterium]|jgi:hypothetical protein
MATVTAQPTPNPAAYKFTIDGYRFDAPITIGSAAEAGGTAFEPLFTLPGVKSIFATANFVTITKDSAADWTGIVDSATETLSIAF